MDPRIVELLARLTEVDDGQLETLEGLLVEHLEDAAGAKDVDVARSLAEAIDRVRAERSQRAEMARERESEIAEIMSRVHAQTDPADLPTDGSEDSSEDAQAEDGSPDADTDPASTTAQTKDRPLPKIADLVRHRTGASSPRSARLPERQGSGTIVIAASDVPGLSAGTEIPDRLTLRKAMVERWQSTAGSRTSGRLPVAKMKMIYPEDRILRAGAEEDNWEKVQRLLAPPALLASGGICAPPAGFYETNTLATAARPLRGALPVFQATRGAIQFIPSISLAGVIGAVGVTTEAQDEAGPTKPCLEITCEGVESATIQAIHRCLQFGNFNARTHPEYVAHITDLTLASHARRAEEELWSEMCTSGTAVTAAESLGAWRDLYAILGRAVVGFRSRHRMELEATIRVVAPGWLATMLSIDLVRQAAGDNTVVGVQRASLEAWLRTLNVSLTWTLEGSVGFPQVFPAQGAGVLNGFPDVVEMLVYPEGTFLFLDGGELDLGIVRDSTLNASNDFQTFAETFETVAFLGPEALCLQADLCASGLAAGLNDSATCGS